MTTQKGYHRDTESMSLCGLTSKSELRPTDNRGVAVYVLFGNNAGHEIANLVHVAGEFLPTVSLSISYYIHLVSERIK
jgi:hypothetical protein